MLSKINAKRKSHFGSVTFLLMLIDTAVSVFILTQTEYTATYPGLLFSILFFGGLSALLFSNYGMHPQLSALVLLLAVGPELVNIFIVHPSSYPAIVLTALCTVLAFEISYPKWLRNGLIVAGISVLQFTKLDELGTYFIDITQGVLSTLSIALLIFYLVFRYFNFASTNSPNNAIITPEFALDALKKGINADFKYKFQPEPGDFLTAEGFSPILTAVPYLAKWCNEGILETIPVLRMFLLNNIPVLEASNIKLSCSNQEFNELNLELSIEGYELILLDEERQGFVLVPKEYAQNWKRSSIAPTTDHSEENEFTPFDDSGEKIIGEMFSNETILTPSLDGQEALTDSLLRDQAQPQEVNDVESSESEIKIPKEEEGKKLVDSMEAFRQRRRFNPNAGRDMKQLRNITKEEGTDDFQWNVPSK
jgi:hypothetical protein